MHRTLIAALAILAATPAAAAAAPVPVPRQPVQIIQDAAAVNRTAALAQITIYAYADVAGNRVITRGPLSRRERAHEIGHLVDYELLTQADRARAAAIMHIDGPWSLLRGASEYFADYYSAAATGFDPRPRHRHGALVNPAGALPYAQDMTWARLQRFRWFLIGVAARDSLPLRSISTIIEP